MKHTVFLLATLVALSGCSNMFAAMGPAEEDPGKRTRGARVEDVSIEQKAEDKVDLLGENFAAANITITSFNGFVLITGQVPEDDMLEKVSESIRDIRGVRRIYNELVVSGNTSTLERSSDAWLDTKVSTQLLAADDIQGGRVEVVVEDGVVYLMGLVSHSEAERIVEVARTTGGVQKVVQIFEWID